MKGESDVVQTFANPDLEHCIYEYLGIENDRFTYRPVPAMEIGQEDQERVYLLPACAAAEINPHKQSKNGLRRWINHRANH